MTEPALPAVRPPEAFDISVGTLVVGAGAAGLTAALAAIEAGEEVLVLERDAVPSGSTALSAGLIPAAGTRWQRDLAVDDNAALFAADIQKKAHGENDPALVQLVANAAGPTVEWLADRRDLPFSLVHDFDYPGHSRRRMHGLPSRSGRELIDALRAAAEGAGVDLLTEALVHTIHAEGQRIHGVTLSRPDGSTERIGCERLILACNGFGGNRPMVAQYMPDIAGALYFGHPGNQGEAMAWGKSLGADIRHAGAYQGHGNVAHPHGILISWAVITEGGCQVNRHGRRFWNEAQGYSEAARVVLAQPDGEAMTVFDGRIAAIARQFADFRDAESQGAVRAFDTLDALAQAFGLPSDALQEAMREFEDAKDGQRPDPFGRPLKGAASLEPPFFAVRVTGALFHTQGGLSVDASARVRRQDGSTFANLHAAGGAACGVSGAGDSGYLSGNGLLAALTLGRIAGAAGGSTGRQSSPVGTESSCCET